MKESIDAPGASPFTDVILHVTTYGSFTNLKSLHFTVIRNYVGRPAWGFGCTALSSEGQHYPPDSHSCDKFERKEKLESNQ